MKSIEILKDKLADLQDSYDHYTMVDKDKSKAFWIKNDIEKVEHLLKDLNMLKDLIQYFPLSEIKKEWEEKGFTWEERPDYHNGHAYRSYYIHKKEQSIYEMRFVFLKYDNTYYAYLGYDTSDCEGYPKTNITPLNLDIEMQNLVTRTLIAIREE